MKNGDKVWNNTVKIIEMMVRNLEKLFEEEQSLFQ